MGILRCRGGTFESSRPLSSGPGIARCLAGLLALSTLMTLTTATPARADPTPPGGRGATTIDLQDLMASLAELRGLVADFDEEKRIALLRTPLRSSGKIYFVAPDRLARVANTPVASRVFVDADRLGFVGGGEAGEITLADQPLAGLFVDSFRMILRGDLAGLRKVYDIEFEALDSSTWLARLTPSAPPLDRFVARIVLAGDGRAVESFTLEERNGDVTEMRFSELQLDFVPPDDLLEPLFQLAPIESP